MKRRTHRSQKHILFMGLSITCVCQHQAYAYLDPGSGSVLYQVLIASLISVLFAVKLSWKKIILLVRHLFTGKKQ